jgi:N-acetylneuraminic acid mutarotase
VWERKRDFPANEASPLQRQYGVALAIDEKGYLTQGTITSTVTWEYNPANDSWKQLADFEGQNRLNSVGFSVDHKGYITTGGNGNQLFDDLWVFDPLAHR